MGCNGSKSTKVQHIGPPGSEGSPKKSSSASKKRGGVLEVTPGENVEVMDNTNSNPDGVRVLKDRKMGSRDSLGSLVETRSQDRLVSSATSKISQRTFDSGLESDYGHVITEYSHPNMVEEDRPPTPDLLVNGLKCESRKSSGKDKRVRTGQDIIGELKSQGILSTAATTAAGQQSPKKGGTSFEVMIAIDFDELKKPPPRLAKLKRKKKKKRTKEEVEAKLKAAEERRKNKESRLREKLNTVKKEAQVHEVIEKTEEVQKKQVEEKMTESLNQAAKNREAHFRAQKERLEQKKKHAEKVRQAKLARMAEQAAQGGEGEEGKEEQTKEEEEDVSAV